MNRLILGMAGLCGVLTFVGCKYDSGYYDPCTGCVSDDHWRFSSQKDYSHCSYPSTSRCDDECDPCCQHHCGGSCGRSCGAFGWLKNKFNEPLDYSAYGSYAYPHAEYREHHGRRHHQHYASHYDPCRTEGSYNYQRYGSESYHIEPRYPAPNYSYPPAPALENNYPVPAAPAQPLPAQPVQPVPAPAADSPVIQQTSFQYGSGNSNETFMLPELSQRDSLGTPGWKPTRTHWQ